MRTFVTEKLTDWQTDGADYIGPAVQRPAGRVQIREAINTLQSVKIEKLVKNQEHFEQFGGITKAAAAVV